MSEQPTLFDSQDQVAFIPLTQGKVAVIDGSDFELVSKYKWHAERRPTKKREDWRAVARFKGNGRAILMHQLILGKKSGLVIDHIDGDGLNNRRSNLRFITQALNSANKHTRKGKYSKFKGVSKNTGGRRFKVSISVNYKGKHLGYYDTEEEAARAYDAAAFEAWGECASLNFPRPLPD